jgi:hypothetical protein
MCEWHCMSIGEEIGKCIDKWMREEKEMKNWSFELVLEITKKNG